MPSSTPARSTRLTARPSARGTRRRDASECADSPTNRASARLAPTATASGRSISPGRRPTPTKVAALPRPPRHPSPSRSTEARTGRATPWWRRRAHRAQRRGAQHRRQRPGRSVPTHLAAHVVEVAVAHHPPGPDLRCPRRPVTGTTSLISFRGWTDRLNQVSDDGNGSSPHSKGGLWRWKTTRSEAQIDDTDAGSMRADAFVDHEVAVHHENPSRQRHRLSRRAGGDGGPDGGRGVHQAAAGRRRGHRGADREVLGNSALHAGRPCRPALARHDARIDLRKGRGRGE